MKRTRLEFEKIALQSLPNSMVSLDSIGPKGEPSICILKSPADYSSDYGTKCNNATHIWYDGDVIKDTDGLFGVNPVSFSVSGSTSPGQAFQVTNNGFQCIILPSTTYPKDFYFVINDGSSIRTYPNRSKCECGSHAIGSNKHSSWCSIKENS